MPEDIGIRLLDYKVLVQLDNPAEMIGSIYIPPNAREDTTQGYFIAASPAAWDYLDATNTEPPVWGERVFCAKYSGRNIKGKNGKDYRIMNDKDIYAILDYKK